LIATDCRFARHTDYYVSAKQRAWLKLRGCQADAQDKKIVEDEARLDA
jgi:hypothetical protein